MTAMSAPPPRPTPHVQQREVPATALTAGRFAIAAVALACVATSSPRNASASEPPRTKGERSVPEKEPKAVEADPFEWSFEGVGPRSTAIGRAETANARCALRGMMLATHEQAEERLRRLPVVKNAKTWCTFVRDETPAGDDESGHVEVVCTNGTTLRGRREPRASMPFPVGALCIRPKATIDGLLCNRFRVLESRAASLVEGSEPAERVQIAGTVFFDTWTGRAWRHGGGGDLPRALPRDEARLACEKLGGSLPHLVHASEYFPALVACLRPEPDDVSFVWTRASGRHASNGMALDRGGISIEFPLALPVGVACMTAPEASESTDRRAGASDTP